MPAGLKLVESISKISGGLKIVREEHKKMF